MRLLSGVLPPPVVKDVSWADIWQLILLWIEAGWSNNGCFPMAINKIQKRINL